MNENKQVTGGGEPLLASSRRHFGKPALLIVAAVLIIGAVALLMHTGPGYLKSSRSNALIGKINNLEKNGQCDSGIKQISPAAPHLSSPDYYTDAAQEKGLTYLMGCSIMTGKNNDALSYANQLSSLYSREHNHAKLQKSQQYITYIKYLNQ